MKTFKILSLFFTLWGASLNATSFTVPESAKDIAAFAAGSAVVLPGLIGLLIDGENTFSVSAPQFTGATIGFGAAHCFDLRGEVVLGAAVTGAALCNYLAKFAPVKSIKSMNDSRASWNSYLAQPLLFTAFGLAALYGASYAGLTNPKIEWYLKA